LKPSPLEREIALARLVIQRLERLSADSIYAHRASGYRGALVRCADEVENAARADQETLFRLRHLTSEGFLLLEEAARELTELHPVVEELRHLMEVQP